MERVEAHGLGDVSCSFGIEVPLSGTWPYLKDTNVETAGAGLSHEEKIFLIFSHVEPACAGHELQYIVINPRIRHDPHPRDN